MENYGSIVNLLEKITMNVYKATHYKGWKNMGKFKEIMYLLFVVVPISIWVVIKLGTFTLVSFIVNLFKRIRLRWKIRRTLIKSGVSRKQARKITKNYISFLKDFSSIRGLTRIIRKTTAPKIVQTPKEKT